MNPEAPPELYNGYAQCRACSGWTYLTGTAETYGKLTNQPDARCGHCGSQDFDPRSVTSKRTWNPLTAKKRKVK